MKHSRSRIDYRLHMRRAKLFAKALALVWLIRLGLWFMPYGTCLRFAARLRRQQTGVRLGSDARLLWGVIWAVETSSRFVPAASCLTKALAADILLTRRQLPSEIRIGVAKDEAGRLKAHAWVESEGEVVLGGSEGLSDFVALGSRLESRES